MRVSLVEQAKRVPYVGWCPEAERNERQYNLRNYIILGRGKVNPGQNWFWSVRPSDETRLGRAGKGNESYMYVGVQRLSETDTNKI